MNKEDDLRWIRVMTPHHIPKYLIEQVKDRDFSVDDFYKFQEATCSTNSKEGVKLNPYSHLYVLANEENLVKGMLWFCVDPLTKDIIIQTFSVDKDYWNKGIAVKKLSTHIKGIRKKANLNKIYWITNYPGHAQRNGFKRSKSILFEYDHTQEKEELENGKGNDGVKRKVGRREPNDTSTDGVSATSNEPTESTGSR